MANPQEVLSLNGSQEGPGDSEQNDTNRDQQVEMQNMSGEGEENEGGDEEINEGDLENGEEGEDVDNEKAEVDNEVDKKYWYRGEIMALVDVSFNQIY